MAKKTIVNRRAERLIKENGEPTHRFIRFLEELNANSNEFIGDLTGFNEFDDLVGIVNALLPNKPDIKVTTINYTTIGDQTIICTDALTVTLNAEPKDREIVKVIISNGDVTVSGNGKLINKLTSVTITFKNLVTTATLDIVYILKTDEWFII